MNRLAVVRVLRCLLLFGFCSLLISAQPSQRMYYFLGDDSSYHMSPYYRAYASNIVIPVEANTMNNEPAQLDTDKRTPMKKNYDRNCFFSPVQCMLSYNTKAHHDAYYGRK